MKLAERINPIKMLILDVDGILTSGKIIYDHTGNEIKVFDVQDGFGIVLFKRSGFLTAILSARSSGAVTARGEDLKFDVICQDASPKTAAYQNIKNQFNLSDEDICFMGDDLTDLGVMRRVGLAVTVPNAVEEVKTTAHHMTTRKGGDGAVREVVEMILKARGLWDGIIEKYHAGEI